MRQFDRNAREVQALRRVNSAVATAGGIALAVFVTLFAVALTLLPFVGLVWVIRHW